MKKNNHLTTYDITFVALMASLYAVVAIIASYSVMVLTSVGIIIELMYSVLIIAIILYASKYSKYKAFILGLLMGGIGGYLYSIFYPYGVIGIWGILLDFVIPGLVFSLVAFWDYKKHSWVILFLLLLVGVALNLLSHTLSGVINYDVPFVASFGINIALLWPTYIATFIIVFLL